MKDRKSCQVKNPRKCYVEENSKCKFPEACESLKYLGNYKQFCGYQVELQDSEEGRERMLGEADIEAYIYYAKEFGIRPESNAQHSLSLLPHYHGE